MTSGEVVPTTKEVIPATGNVKFFDSQRSASEVLSLGGEAVEDAADSRVRQLEDKPVKSSETADESNKSADTKKKSEDKPAKTAEELQQQIDNLNRAIRQERREKSKQKEQLDKLSKLSPLVEDGNVEGKKQVIAELAKEFGILPDSGKPTKQQSQDFNQFQKLIDDVMADGTDIEKGLLQLLVAVTNDVAVSLGTLNQNQHELNSRLQDIGSKTETTESKLLVDALDSQLTAVSTKYNLSKDDIQDLTDIWNDDKEGVYDELARRQKKSVWEVILANEFPEKYSESNNRDRNSSVKRDVSNSRMSSGEATRDIERESVDKLSSGEYILRMLDKHLNKSTGGNPRAKDILSL